MTDDNRFGLHDVVDGGFCVGCGACGVATGGRITIPLTNIGIRQANLGGIDDVAVGQGCRVCPFTDETPDETAISEELYPDLATHDVLGRYRSVRAGRVTDVESVTRSSSGGMTSWVVNALIEYGHVDGVVHVGSATDEYFAYKVSSSAEEALASRKSIYYSTTMADAVNSVRGDGKRYAFVGVPCFVTALRHLQRENADLADQFPFVIGLVCGHLKSTAFAQLLAWQLGIAPSELAAVDFRVKRPGHDAADYAFGATAKDGRVATALNRELMGANWGHAMMQLKACDFCDDIFAETADVVLGDAWLEEYREDWRGTNVIVSRHPIVDELLDAGESSGALFLESIGADRAAASQGGNFRHRRVGLSVRLADDLRAGHRTPPKRVLPGQYVVTDRRRKLIRQRRHMSAISHAHFAAALKDGELRRFTRPMRREVSRYQILELGPVLGTMMRLVPSVARSRLLKGRAFRLLKRMLAYARGDRPSSRRS